MASRRSPRRPTAPGVGFWVALAFVLSGLFGMHGLTDRGTAHMVGAQPAVASTDHTAMPIALHPVGTHASSTASAMPEGHGRQGPSDSMVGFCVAVLFLTGTALALLLQRSNGISVFRQTGGRWRTFGRAGRDRDPPSLTWLSIRRC